MPFYPGYYPPINTGCPCDNEFVEYCKKFPEVRSVFHFGTGIHHIVGRELIRLGWYVLGVTASRTEHAAYTDLVNGDPDSSKHSNYLCLYADLYTLPTELLPRFDYITMFHLCEYSQSIEDDRLLIDRIEPLLNPNGTLFTWRGSKEHGQAKKLINRSVFSTYQYRRYKSLELYTKQ